MNKFVSAAEANRNFSKLLKDAKDGLEVIVTSHGEPVVSIKRIEKPQNAVSDEAWKAFLEELGKMPARNAGRWTREELYEDDSE
ncbi:MAG TPA: type II toxin-antitoxin system prevent-host-death family antitoxin [Rhizomicrobium sp.]|nr:type II toxin-antitoxin system prevent-host-death family antitoxin [Rhizomicrobium sp.]